MSTIRRVRLEDLQKEMGRHISAGLSEQRKAVLNAVIGSIPDLVANSPVDTGQYAASWDYREDDEGVTIGNYAPHAGIIESGTRPYRPPITPLLLWAKRVLQDPCQPPDFSSECWGLARYVQQKIEREGIKPRHVMENLIPLITARIEQELDKLG